MNDSLIHLRVPAATKARWVRASRAAGMRLTDWITKAVEAHRIAREMEGSMPNDAIEAAPRGRPRLPEGQGRVQMQISVKPEQRDMLKRLAADSGVSVSALVIQSVIKSHNNG